MSPSPIIYLTVYECPPDEAPAFLACINDYGLVPHDLLSVTGVPETSPLGEVGGLQLGVPYRQEASDGLARDLAYGDEGSRTESGLTLREHVTPLDQATAFSTWQIWQEAGDSPALQVTHVPRLGLHVVDTTEGGEPIVTYSQFEQIMLKRGPMGNAIDQIGEILGVRWKLALHPFTDRANPPEETS